MDLTRIDYSFYRSPDCSVDESSCVALNPRLQPGSFVFAGSCAAKQSISSQVACRLSLEHFVGSVLGTAPQVEDSMPEERSLQLLEAAFRSANTNVYQFGHSMAAGGRMSATLLGLVLDGRFASAGRAGDGSAYLLRGVDIYPFFEEVERQSEVVNEEDYLGERSLVTVDLASVSLEEEDSLLLFPRRLTEVERARLHDFAQIMKGSRFELPAFELSRTVFEPDQQVQFMAIVETGPEAILLKEVVELPN